MTTTQAGAGSPLRQLLTDTAANLGVPMKDLTVMSAGVDPFRLDTPAMHRDWKWLAATAATQGLAPRPVLDSRWSFAEQTRALIDDKAYRNGAVS